MVNHNERTEHVVIAAENGEPIAQFSLDQPAMSQAFVSADQIATYDGRQLITIQVIDAKTGKTIRTYQPFWWVMPLLGVSCAAYVAWSLCWLRKTFAISVIGFDVLVLLGLPILALLGRLSLTGDSYDLARHPVHILEGIGGAMVVHSAIWWSMGRGRFVLRGIPALVSTLMVLGMCHTLLPNDVSVMWQSLAFVGLILISLVSCCELTKRIFGVRFDDAIATARKDEGVRMHLKDMFIATASVAALVALWPRSLPGLDIYWWGPLQIMAAAIIGPLVGLVAVMLPRGRWLPLTLSLIGLGTVALIVPPMHSFLSGKWRPTLWFLMPQSGWWWKYGQQVTVLTSGFVASLWIGLRFRVSNWRFTRAG